MLAYLTSCAHSFKAQSLFLHFLKHLFSSDKLELCWDEKEREGVMKEESLGIS